MTDQIFAQVVILCVGNSLVSDDAVGCHIYKYLKSRLNHNNSVRLELLGIGGLTLLDKLKGEPLMIIVDAITLGYSHGEVVVLDWKDIPQSAGQAVSLHGIGPREAIEVGWVLYPEIMPKKVILVGVEGSCFNIVGEMTDEVKAAIEPAAKEVERILAEALTVTGFLKNRSQTQ